MGSIALSERVWLFLLESTHVSAGARLALFCLIGLLLVALGFLIACAWMIRKRGSAWKVVRRRRSWRFAADLKDAVFGGRREPGRDELYGAIGGTLACPTCRREYASELEFCPRDARRLVRLTELGGSKSAGRMCPICRRAFDPGVRFCPSDAAELLPVSIYEAKHGCQGGPSPTGVIAKICPQCRSRHDLSATFCGKDGSELAVIN